MTTSRRAALGACLAAPFVFPSPLRAQAGYPSKPVRLIVTYPPGGVTDIVGRVCAEAMGPKLGQPVVVENRAGAGGNIGVQAAAQAEPDGYTLLFGTAATHGVNPVLYANSGVDAVRDFAAVGTAADMPNVLSVNPKRLDVKNVAELVAAGKARKLVYGSVGNGSSSHLSAAVFLRGFGFEAEHVPYRGSSPAVAALLAGDFDFLFDTTATTTAHARSGAFRSLAVTSARRSSALPDVPTLEEAGLPGYDLSIWMGVFVGRRAPEPVLAKLRDAFNAGMDEAVRNRLRATYTDPLLVPTADLDKWVEAEKERWGRLAREAKLTVD